MEKNLPTVGLVVLAEQEHALVEDHKLVVQELAEVAIHAIAARLEGVRDAEADPEAAIHTMAARLEVVIHTMAARLGVACGAEADLEAVTHMIAAVEVACSAAEEDLEAATHMTVVQQLVEVACRAEAEGHRIHSGVEAGVEHRIAVGVGPADHACPSHPVPEEELQMVWGLQGC